MNPYMMLFTLSLAVALGVFLWKKGFLREEKLTGRYELKYSLYARAPGLLDYLCQPPAPREKKQKEPEDSKPIAEDNSKDSEKPQEPIRKPVETSCAKARPAKVRRDCDDPIANFIL